MVAMNLLDHLESWSAEELSYLMERRPDLLPATDRGLEAVARKAATAMSLGRALVGADVGMLVVAEALVAKHPASVADLDHLLGTGDMTAIIDAVDRLRRIGVVVVEDRVISPVGALPDLLHRPLGLGPSFIELAEHLATDTIERLAITTLAEGAAKRSATVRAIAHRLSQSEVLAAVMADAPADSLALFETLVSRRSPAIPLPTGYPYRGLDADDPLNWLMDNGLVVAVTESVAELPREPVIASRPAGLAPTAAVRPVELRPVDGVGPDVVAGTSADNANRLLDGAETLLRLVDRGEVSIRKAGGIGPRELKRLAKLCRLDQVDVARLFELLAVARLLKVSGGTVSSADVAARWWSLRRYRRYLVLVRAWLAADRFLSRGLLDDPDGTRIVALGEREPVAAVAAARTATLATICTLAPGAAFQPGQLAEAVVWQGPNLWGAGDPPPELLVEWTLAEARFLGLVANDAASDIGRGLLACDETLVDHAAEAALGDDQDKLVLQADLTAVSFGPLAPSVARSLGEMTERIDGGGDGRAPGFRFTEAGIRRAFDRGWTVESITGFLTEHGLAGVPQPLAYLLDDVDRRYGSIRVMPAQAIIVTADDISAVEIAANRKTAKLGLRLVAPTVLTSPLDPVTVVESLRALGMFPVLEGSSVVIDEPRAATGADAAIDGSPGDLPADWSGPPVPTGPFPDEVSDAVAQLQSAGSPTPPGRADDNGHGGGADDPTPAGEQRVTTAALLQPFWGRTVAVDALIGGTPDRLTGTLVGLGPVTSLLTTTGVVELATESIIDVADPETV